MWETQIQSLGQEDSLEKEMATHSTILALRIPWMEEPGSSPWGHKESDMTEQLHFHFLDHLSVLSIYCDYFFSPTKTSTSRIETSYWQ